VTDGGGLSSNTVTATVTVTAPPVLAAPTNLAATISASRTVKLTWVDNAATETGYKVERATVNSKGVVQTYAVVATLGANSLTYTQSVSKATYSYRVQAYDATQKVYSNAVKIVVP
jgi:hypothetical protein